jgi:hypothetical protein
MDSTRERLLRTHGNSAVAQKYDSVFFRPGEGGGGEGGDAGISVPHSTDVNVAALPVINVSQLAQNHQDDLQRLKVGAGGLGRAALGDLRRGVWECVPKRWPGAGGGPAARRSGWQPEAGRPLGLTGLLL